jgi:hypothetical protein
MKKIYLVVLFYLWANLFLLRDVRYTLFPLMEKLSYDVDWFFDNFPKAVTIIKLLQKYLMR